MRCIIRLFILFVSFPLTLPFGAFGQEMVKSRFISAKNEYYRGYFKESAGIYASFLTVPDSILIRQLSRNELITCFSQIGEINWSERKFTESVFFYSRALSLCSEKDPLQEIPFFLFKIGRSLYSLSDFTGASLAYAAALDYYSRKNPPANSVEIATVLNNLGLCKMNLGNLPDAEKLFRESESLAQNKGLIREQIKALNNLAILRQKQNKTEESIGILNKSIVSANLLNDSVMVAAQKGNLANALLSKGEYREAIDLFRQSIALQNHPVPSYNNLAIAFLNSGNIDSAGICNRIVLNMIRDPAKPGSETSLSDCLDALSISEAIHLARYKLTGNQEEVSSGFDLFNQGMYRLLNGINEEFTVDYLKSFLDKHRSFFTVSMKSALLLDSLSPGKIPRSAIVSEAMKAVSTLDVSNIRHRSKNGSGWESECIALNESWHYIDDFIRGRHRTIPLKNLFNTLSINPFEDSPEIADYKNHLIRVFDTIESGLIKKNAQSGERNILDYFLMDDELIIHIYSAKGICVKRIFTDRITPRNLEELTAAILQLRSDAVRDISARLSRLFIEPVIPYLETGEILIIPDDNTIRVPMEMLRTVINGNQVYLIDQWAVSYSFTLLDWWPTVTSSPKHSYNFFGFAPDYFQSGEFNNLIYNIKEIESIDSLYRNSGYRSLKITGPSARLDTLLRYAPLSAILSVSTHVTRNDSVVQLSHLRIGEGQPLYLPAFRRIRFNSDLLILGGCSTLEGFSDYRTTYNSLLKSLCGTEVSWCLGSMWKLYDSPFMKFNIEFNRRVIAGESYVSALQKTKKLFIASEEYNQPVFWAGIQLFEISHRE